MAAQSSLRKHPRHALNIPIEVIEEDSGRGQEGETHDIAVGGMGLIYPCMLPTGSPLTLLLPQVVGYPTTFPVEATVVYSLQSAGRTVLGVKFKQVTPELSDYVQRLVSEYQKLGGRRREAAGSSAAPSRTTSSQPRRIAQGTSSGAASSQFGRLRAFFFGKKGAGEHDVH